MAVCSPMKVWASCIALHFKMICVVSCSVVAAKPLTRVVALCPLAKCRLLYHRVRPVFVFDGTTPALKKQTVAARRRSVCMWASSAMAGLLGNTVQAKS